MIQTVKQHPCLVMCIISLLLVVTVRILFKILSLADIIIQLEILYQAGMSTCSVFSSKPTPPTQPHNVIQWFSLVMCIRMSVITWCDHMQTWCYNKRSFFKVTFAQTMHINSGMSPCPKGAGSVHEEEMHNSYTWDRDIDPVSGKCSLTCMSAIPI
jgi:hypothetical protein